MRCKQFRRAKRANKKEGEGTGNSDEPKKRGVMNANIWNELNETAKMGVVIVNVWNEANEANETKKMGVCDCKCLERGKRGKRDNEKGEGSL